MANPQLIHSLLFFLALTACLEIQFAEGRQLKAKDKQESGPVKVEEGLESHAKRAVNFIQWLENHIDNLKISGKKKISPLTTPKSQSHEFSSSEVSYKAASQSTTPVNSPGVGHPFAAQKHNVHSNVQGFTSVAGKADDYQATTTGHSPGIGHSIGNFKAGPNA